MPALNAAASGIPERSAARGSPGHAAGRRPPRYARGAVLLEAPVRTNHGTATKRVRVLINPTLRQFLAFEATLTGRAYAMGEVADNIIVWDGGLAGHADIASATGRNATDMVLDPEALRIESLDPEWNEAEMHAYALRIGRHPMLKRIYGGSVPLVEAEAGGGIVSVSAIPEAA